MDTEKRVAVYMRVSTKDKQDPENQRLQLIEYCKRQNWSIVDDYGDRLSGKESAGRDDFQRLMTDASRKRFDVVLVWALDRFTREGVEETFKHIARLRDYGVAFESYTEPHFRTTGPAGELMLAVSAWIAKQERIRLHERITAGVERAQSKGVSFGRAGWKTRQGTLSPEKMAIIVSMAGRRSHRDIAIAAGVGKGTVYRVLKSRPVNTPANVEFAFVGDHVEN